MDKFRHGSLPDCPKRLRRGGSHWVTRTSWRLRRWAVTRPVSFAPGFPIRSLRSRVRHPSCGSAFVRGCPTCVSHRSHASFLSCYSSGCLSADVPRSNHTRVPFLFRPCLSFRPFLVARRGFFSFHYVPWILHHLPQCPRWDCGKVWNCRTQPSKLVLSGRRSNTLLVEAADSIRFSSTSTHHPGQKEGKQGIEHRLQGWTQGVRNRTCDPMGRGRSEWVDPGFLHENHHRYATPVGLEEWLPIQRDRFVGSLPEPIDGPSHETTPEAEGTGPGRQNEPIPIHACTGRNTIKDTIDAGRAMRGSGQPRSASTGGKDTIRGAEGLRRVSAGKQGQNRNGDNRYMLTSFQSSNGGCE